MDLSLFFGTMETGAAARFLFPEFMRFGNYLLLLMFSHFALGSYLSIHTTEKFKLALTFFLVAGVFFNAIFNYRDGLRHAPYGGNEQAESHAYWAAQEWAAAYTADNASFILVDPNTWHSWRSLTRRPMIKTNIIGGIYRYSERIDEHNKLLAEWVGQNIGEEYLVPNYPYTRLSGPRLLRQLDERQLLDFAEVFGGDYAVVKKTSLEWNLPIAYENEIYKVYALYFKHVP
jgi:hypothetical protein